MRLKLKSKTATTTINLDDNSKLFKDFLTDIQHNGELHPDCSEVVAAIKKGFPPKPIDLSFSLDTTIQDKDIKDGDQLLIDFASYKRKSTAESSLSPQPAEKKPNLREDIPAAYIEALNKYLILRNIPDDNSCLFNSISYAISGYDSYNNISPPQELRTVVADYINRDPELYSDLVLGRPRDEYCDWIKKKESWGGAIELGILADWFNVRIVCIDIELGNFIRFENEKTTPEKFIILIYSGIHYDVLAMNDELSLENKASDVAQWTIKDPHEEDILTASQKLCKLLQSKDYSTNTTTFRVRCLDCYLVLVGEMGASKHAEETGHLNFGEVKKS
ncbi:Ubiquitin thioesterase OTU1 [Candida viswanathii]|uniref:Ubiquitin thioesterase OTU n=1 Tax=Candida viswanathii TaxID=5486 RepID=A0A367Y527_9ASCO|nr:Ubiquitin thioesterase OTU1 [Candida viswanathii]